MMRYILFDCFPPPPSIYPLSENPTEEEANGNLLAESTIILRFDLFMASLTLGIGSLSVPNILDKFEIWLIDRGLMKLLTGLTKERGL